jgi:purine-binding chemotaxis protein CheW
VIETMRPLPVEALVGAPSFIIGIAVIRGEPVPVVDAARLLGGEPAQPRRLVTLRGGRRPVALAVDAVLGVRDIAAAQLSALTPLAGAIAGELVVVIGTLDHRLLVVLQTARLVPDAVFDLIQQGAS